MIHICYGLYDERGLYSKFTGTSMLSMFENTSAPPNSITVHILHDSTLTQSNHDNFVAIAEKYKQKIDFFNVEIFYQDKIRIIVKKLEQYVNGRYSIGAFYRLMLNKNSFNEKISKMIYLDSDTIVNLDIQELWDYPIEDYTIAAVPEFWATRAYMITDKYLLHTGKIQIEDYFCSGVLVLNLEKIDEKFFYESIDWLSKNLQCECPDQDLLNNFFSTEYCKLPEKFNAFVGVAKNLDNNLVYKKIYHYSGDCLGIDTQSGCDRLFFKYFVKTPWFNIDMFQNMREGILQILMGEGIDLAIRISAAVSGKQRAFAVEPEVLEKTKDFFRISSFEEIISINPENPAKAIINSLKKSPGRKIFFIMSDKYEEIGQRLLNAGFVESEDFVNALLFFKSAPQNTKFLCRVVYAM